MRICNIAELPREQFEETEERIDERIHESEALRKMWC
jgi:hypothetical protein